MRKLTLEEVQWLSQYALGVSHGIMGGTNLAACEDCDWTAQAESIDFLMAEVTKHLEESFEPPTDDEWVQRRAAFISEFDWDPWEEGNVLNKAQESHEDGSHTHTFDIMMITERSTDGDVVGQEFFSKDLGPDEAEDE